MKKIYKKGALNMFNIFTLILSVSIIAVAFLLLKNHFSSPQVATNTSVLPIYNGTELIYEENLSETTEEYQHTDENTTYIVSSMNANPTFQNGSEKGDLYIKNILSNKHPQYVEIYLDETNKLIYSSKAIPAGKILEKDSLDVILNKGQHLAKAFIYTVDEESASIINTQEQYISITVLN